MLIILLYFFNMQIIKTIILFIHISHFLNLYNSIFVILQQIVFNI